MRIAHTLHVGFKVFVPHAGKVCGVATHAVGRDASYGLLHFGGFKVQAAFLLGMYGRHLCRRRYRLPQGIERVGNKCPPYACYTSVLKFVPPADRVCGAATHAVGGDVGYGLLHLGFKVCAILRWGVWRSHERG